MVHLLFRAFALCGQAIAWNSALLPAIVHVVLGSALARVPPKISVYYLDR